MKNYKKSNYSTKNKNTILSLLEKDICVTEDKEKAGFLNDFFASQSPLDLSMVPPLPISYSHSFLNAPIL